MKKIIVFAVVFCLFCGVNVFAEDKSQNNKEEFERLKSEKIKEILQWIYNLPSIK